MSAASCKVVIDWYGALAAEANGFSRLTESVSPVLSAEASALATASEAICDAGKEMVEYLESEDGDENAAATIHAIVALSGKACDWAKDLRRYSDAFARDWKKMDTSHVAHVIEEMRSWRDAGTDLIRTIAEAQIASGK